MKKKYTVKKPFVHDGTTQIVGLPIELEDENATYLLRRGDIEDPAKKAERKQAPRAAE
jgi:hypothetical protein